MLNIIKKLFNLPERIETTSVSPNPKVRCINLVIAENEEKDGEYWISIGNQELQNIFNDFSEPDWQDLEDDIKNWTSQQQTILADNLIIKTFSVYDVCSLYGYIFLNVNDEDAVYLAQNIGFINSCGQKPAEFITAIVNRIENINTLNQNTKNSYIFTIKSLK